MGSWQPPNPDWQETTRRFLMDMPVARFLELELSLPEPGRTELSMPYRPELAFRQGILQAGAAGIIGDLAAGLSCHSMLPPGFTTATVDYSLKLMAPSGGDRLVAEGRLIQAGQAISVGTAEIWSVRGDRRRQAGVLFCTMHNFRLPPPKPDRAAQA